MNLLRRVGRVPAQVTDGAWSPDGRTLVLRDYQAAHVFAASGGRLATVALPLQVQGESIAFSPDGRDLLVGSEGAGSEIWWVPLPKAATLAVATTPLPAAVPPRSRTGSLPLVALAAGVALLGGASAWRRRRRRAGLPSRPARRR